MSKFKVGDKVRRTGANFSHVKAGEVYEVSEIKPWTATLHCLRLKGISGSYSENLFELFNPSYLEKELEEAEEKVAEIKRQIKKQKLPLFEGRKELVNAANNFAKVFRKILSL